MKKSTLAVGLMASFLAISQPHQEQIAAVTQSVKQIQHLTYNEAKTDEVFAVLGQLCNELAMLNSFIAANKFRVTESKFIPDFERMRKDLIKAVALVREYSNTHGKVSNYRAELRAFSNEVFKFELAVNKIRQNYGAFTISHLDSVEFSQQDLDTLVSRSTQAHL